MRPRRNPGHGTGSAGGKIDNTKETATFNSSTLSASKTELKAFSQKIEWNGRLPDRSIPVAQRTGAERFLAPFAKTTSARVPWRSRWRRCSPRRMRRRAPLRGANQHRIVPAEAPDRGRQRLRLRARPGRPPRRRGNRSIEFAILPGPRCPGRWPELRPAAPRRDNAKAWLPHRPAERTGRAGADIQAGGQGHGRRHESEEPRDRRLRRRDPGRLSRHLHLRRQRQLARNSLGRGAAGDR